MSKFWQAGNTAVSESESESDSEPDVQPQQRLGRIGANTYDESESESEEEVRVVKSTADRALDNIRDGVLKIKNSKKNNDWSTIQDEFDSVNRQIEKSRVVLANIGIPKFYIKMLAEVEDFLSAALKDKEALKKMKPTVSYAINRMKLTVKKHNSKYSAEIADYRLHPENYQDIEEKADSSSEDVDDEESDDDEGDDSFDDDDDEEESSEEEEELKGRARWLKKVEKPDKISVPTQKQRRKVESQQQNHSDNLEIEAKKKPVVTRVMEHDMKEDVLDKKLAEVMVSRGRKSTDPKEILLKLEVLSKASRKFGPRKEIPVLMHLISAMYDSQRSIDDYMNLEQWRTCYRCILRVTQLLRDNADIVLGVIPTEDVSDLVLAAPLLKLVKKKGEDLEEEDVRPVSDGSLKVVGSLESFIARLEDEYTKSLQQINPHTQDYVVRLSDEAMLIELAEVIYEYYRRINDNRAAAIVALLHVEHIYYKHDTVAAAVQRAHLFSSRWGRHADIHPASTGKILGNVVRDQRVTHPAAFLGNPTVVQLECNSSAKLEGLCQFIFKCGDERTKTRALLCSVYHHALHDRYYRARDLFLMSHIQDTIDKVDTKTQILYNRALVTLGLAAFRIGLTQKAHDCLAGICSGRIKELLAQGQARWHEKDPEQEKIERRRQIPYHMHINPDLLECCHMLSAMFLELPYLSKPTSGNALNAVSKPFRKYMQLYNRQVFVGPPENIREHVVAAAKSLLNGEWRKACDLILNLDVWNLIPGGSVKVRAMLLEKIKEEAVRTYVISYGSHYQSILLSHLCEMFDMEQTVVKRIVSRMIFLKEISAAWECGSSLLSDDMLVLYSVDSTPLQSLSQQLNEKICQLVESNERLLDPLVNAYNYREDWGNRMNSATGNRGQSWAASEQSQYVGAQQGDRRRLPGWRSSRPNIARQGFRTAASGGRGRGAAGRSNWGRVNTTNRPQQAQQDTSNRRDQSSAAIAVSASDSQPVRRPGWGHA